MEVTVLGRKPIHGVHPWVPAALCVEGVGSIPLGMFVQRTGISSLLLTGAVMLAFALCGTMDKRKDN